MQGAIEVKLRKIGTSIGVLIPNDVIKEGNYRAGDKIEISIWSKPTKREIERAFGSAKWLKGWKREKRDRDRF